MPGTSAFRTCAAPWDLAEIGIIVINLSDIPYTISDGERIAQLVIKEYVHVAWEPVSRLDETKRGDGGFGHTGVE